MPFRQRPVTRLMGRCFSATAFAALLSTALFSQPAAADDLADIQRLLKGGQQAQALSKAEAALAQKPRDPQLRFVKGVVLAEMNRSNEAVAIFSRLTEEYPYLPEPWNNLAVLYAGQGQIERARTALERAIQTNPSYAAAYENLGDVHARLASQAYERALQIDSGNANAPSRLNLVRSLATPWAPPPLRLAENTVQLNAGPASAPAKSGLPPLAQAPATPGATTKPSAPAAQPQAPMPAPPSAATSKAPAGQSAPAPAGPVKPPASPAAPAKMPATPAPAPTAPPPKPAEAKPAKPDAAAIARERARRAEEAEREAVLATVHGWARDWSARNVKGYLDHYASDFETPGRQSRKAWAEERQARIVGKGRINVKVEAPQVSVEGNHATVRFRQQYTSDRLTVSSRKTLVLVRQRGKWLIQKESTGS